LCIFLVALTAAISTRAPAQDLDGAKVSLPGYKGPAVLRTESFGKFKFRVDVDAKGEAGAISVGVELPNSGANAWPAADVEVRDASGKALLVQRTGIEWFKMMVPLPKGVTSCVVHAVEPPGGWLKPTPDKDRAIQDTASGVRMRVAKWHDGRAAALSIRFDDSHPTHLTKAVPILNEYGFRGTFMICPGAAEPGSRRVSEFDQHRAAWEAIAKQGGHELANHSAHHRGGFGDEDMESEVGEAARAIRQLNAGRSKLTALNLGGGTRWETTRTLRYYLDKYQHFDASENSTGMDDSYGNRVENFRRILDQHLQRGLWCRIHYHYIGDGLSSTEANFRAALDIAKQHQTALWIAGMADIHKYQTERNAAKLALLKSDARSLSFRLTCATDPALYDQPLTMEVVPPAAWTLQKLVVKDAKGAPVATTPGTVEGAAALRFVVPPREADYTVEAGS
jgi:peptidoglycan/xylan/chitin deacetylase (PgdA/CDA1 family)